MSGGELYSSVSREGGERVAEHFESREKIEREGEMEEKLCHIREMGFKLKKAGMRN